MVRPDDIVNFTNSSWFSGLAGFGQWLVNIILSIVVLAGIYWFYVYNEHKIKVTIFPIFGSFDKDQLKDKQLSDLKEMNVQIGHPIKARGKDKKDKGVKKFSLMVNPLKFLSIPPIAYEKRYPDGIWMLQTAKDEYMIIGKPSLSDTVNFYVPDPDLDLWQEVAEEKIRQRTSDEDMMKKQFMMAALVILGAFVLAGVIIWLSMSFAGNSINGALTKVDQLIPALQGLATGQAPG